MEINERNRAAIFSEGKEGSGGDFCEEGEVHSDHIIPAIRRERRLESSL